MKNQLLGSFYFSVLFAGQGSEIDTMFQEVSGLNKTLGTEEVSGGGENRFKYRLPTQVSFENLILKRGIVLMKSPLIDWCQQILDNGLVMAIKPKDVIVKLLNTEGQTCQTWTFVKAYPVRWSVSDLNSEKSALLIETIELSFQYFNLERNNRE